VTDSSYIKDEELVKLDRLQLINASARFELISANQQLLDFHLSRIMNKKFKKKKTFNPEKAGFEEGALNQVIVCEDIDNESVDMESSMNYDHKDKDQINKRERIKQLNDPHQIMQE
jgi:hypothetical protein